MLKHVVVITIVFIGLIGRPAGAQPTTAPAGRFASEIEAFEKQDRESPPPASPILFVGSSTIRFWETAKAYPNLVTLNRGFGGSEVSDVLFYYDRIVLKYHPSQIVFYAGDNDLNSGKSVARVVSDTREFITKIRKDLPNAKLIMVAIKPSVARWKLIGQMRDANRQIKETVLARPGDVVVDVESQVLGKDGKPRAELFRIDGLHFNDKGYEILNAAVKPYLSK